MKPFIILVLLAFSICSFGQNIDIPDPNFKAALIADEVDRNGDGEISRLEAEQTESLLITGFEIEDITGINNFVNLKELNCSYNNITSIYLDGLTQLRLLSCIKNSISSLVINDAS